MLQVVLTWENWQIVVILQLPDRSETDCSHRVPHARVLWFLCSAACSSTWVRTRRTRRRRWARCSSAPPYGRFHLGKPRRTSSRLKTTRLWSRRTGHNFYLTERRCLSLNPPCVPCEAQGVLILTDWVFNLLSCLYLQSFRTVCSLSFIYRTEHSFYLQ